MSSKSLYAVRVGDLAQVIRGILMGGADIIPGVSGGTVALILGIYDRLVGAISRFDTTLLGHLKRRDLAAAAAHVDLRFLATLGTGIALGIGGLASLMHYLLENQTQHTFGAFFGLILASSLLVARHVGRWSAGAAVALAAGAAFAFALVGLSMLRTPPEGNLYVFFCGAIAICAMILPGISGAFILLLLGKYADITGLLRSFLGGNVTLDGIATLVAFCAGCGLGLVGFCKLLKWLLARYERVTMAVLCGFMLGSLRKIWPFQTDTTPDVAKFSQKVFVPEWPAATTTTWITIAIAAAAFVFVLALDHVSRTPRSKT